MKEATLHLTLSRAVKAMQATLQKLTLPESTFVLQALPCITELAVIRNFLAARIQKQVTASWLENGDMFLVFSALTALWEHDTTLVSGDYLAQAVRRLVNAEATTGGPYCSNGVAGIAANAQIAIFARHVAQPLPNEERFLGGVITKKNFDTPELTVPGLLYLLSKACASPNLRRYTSSCQSQPAWQTPQNLAIALTILGLQARHTPLTKICEQQQADGLWAAEPLLKSTPPSQLVTSALIIEALSKYAPPTRQNTSALRQHNRVAAAAKEMFNAYHEPLRSTGIAAVNAVCGGNNNLEITLSPQLFLQPTTNASKYEQLHTTLGLASLYGWIAYGIYDDFLDNEGKLAALPVAHIAMRASLDCFQAALPDNQGFQRYVNRVFAAMDEVNAWEVHTCRFRIQSGTATIAELPKYGNASLLARQAFAHALAPMAVLAQRHMLRGDRARHIKNAFQHYLIARKINDDLRDWFKDMNAGHLSFVVTAILRDMRIKPGDYDLQPLLAAMQKHFRRTTIPQLCTLMLRHISMSTEAFKKSGALPSGSNMYALLHNLEASVHQALDQHKKSMALHIK